MADRIIRIVLAGDSAGAVRALREVDSASEGTTKDLEAHSDRQSRAMGRTRDAIGRVSKMALLAGATGVGALAYGIAKATKAGMEMQSQQALLQNSLRDTGIYSTQTMSKLTALASSMSGRGGFGAQENIQSLTQLTRVTGSATQATKLFGLATNVARGSHKDLLQVTKALALAEQGRTTGLSRMGIVLAKGTTPAQAMQILQQRFGGATAAFSRTAAGGVANLSQSFSVLKEDFSRAFLPLVSTLSRSLMRLMPMISGALGAIAKPLSATLQKLLPPLLSAIVKILPPVLNLIDSIIPPLVSVLNTVIPVITGAIQQLLPVFQQALRSLVPVVNVLVSVFTRYLATILPPLLRIFSQVMPILTNAFQVIAPPLMRALSTVVTALAPVITRLVTSLAPLFPMLANAVVKILPPLAKAITSLMPALTQVISALLPPFVAAFEKLVPPLTTALIKLMPAITLLSKIVGGLLSLNPFHDDAAVHSTLRRAARVNPFPAEKHAAGGIIGGYGPPDSVLSWMTPGEGVLTPPAVQAIGGQAGLNALNATGHLTGHQLPDRDIVINLKAVLGQRIVAEETVRYGLRKVALS
jgi:phage-related protein